MPITDFRSMPRTARAWVFGATAPLTGVARDALLHAVDEHLARWRAHGAPLVCARDWRDDRFLAIAVDEAATGASGCSIDGLFRVLTDMEQQLRATLTDAGMVFWRDASGSIVSDSRSAFRAHAQTGAVTMTTPIFDTTISTVGAWSEQFEQPAAHSWHARLLAPVRTTSPIPSSPAAPS